MRRHVRLPIVATVLALIAMAPAQSQTDSRSRAAPKPGISWTSLMLALSRCEQRAVLRAVTSRRELDPRNG